MLEKVIVFSTPLTASGPGSLSGQLMVVELECVVETDASDLESRVSCETIGRECNSAKSHSLNMSGLAALWQALGPIKGREEPQESLGESVSQFY